MIQDHSPDLGSSITLRSRIKDIDVSPWVTIDHERIRELIPMLQARTSETTEPLMEANPSLQGLELAFLFNAANFSYWPDKGEKKWLYLGGSKDSGGSEGLFRALEDSKESTSWHAENFVDMTPETFEELLGTDKNIPMKKERLECIRNAARNLLEHTSDGRYLSFVANAHGDALELLQSLVAAVPSYRDVSLWQGIKLPFLKRAQLLVKTTNDYLMQFTEKGLSNMEKLTAFSDYKVPYVLAWYGMIHYNDKIRQMLLAQEEMPQDSEEEVVIRIATLLAVTAISEESAKMGVRIDEEKIDTILWLMGREKAPDDVLPFHRTRTLAY